MQGFCSHNVGSLKNGPLREGRSRGLLDAEKPDGLMDRIRAGNGPKSVQEPGVQKTFVTQTQKPPGGGLCVVLVETVTSDSWPRVRRY